MIRVEQLSKRYGNLTAIDQLDLCIQRQEVCGLLGPNGAGKTTLIRILSTLALPTSGRALVNGFDVVKQPVEAKMQIGVVHQTLNLDPELTGTESLRVHGMLFGMKRSEIRARADELLEFAGLTPDRDRSVNHYSGGMKRKLTIARALMHHPKLIILDEPTVGLDVQTRRKVWALMRRMREEGSTILLATHYIEEAEQLADRVAIIDRGKLIALGPPHDLVRRMGCYTVDISSEREARVVCFETRKQATDYLARSGTPGTVRPASLEDVFIRLTGRRVSHG